MFVVPRLEEIKRRSTPAHPVCLKCGDQGHKAIGCRNALICFRYNKTGHKSFSCPSFVSLSLPRNSNFTKREVDSPSDQAMAPPGNRRGVARARYQSFGTRPGTRDTHPPPPHGYTAPQALAPPQAMPDRPFTGQAMPVHNVHQEPPPRLPIAQVPPDHPIQQRA